MTIIVKHHHYCLLPLSLLMVAAKPYPSLLITITTNPKEWWGRMPPSDVPKGQAM
jgi:hypothetical protein